MSFRVIASVATLLRLLRKLRRVGVRRSVSSLSLLAITAGRPVRLNRLPRVRHRRGEAAIHRNRLAVDVRRLVAGQKQSHRRQLMRLAGALERIELADLVLGAALLGAIKYRLSHAGLDQAGANRVDAHAGARQRIGCGLHETNDAGLAGAVRVTAGAGLQARDRCRADDRAVALPSPVRDGVFAG